MGGIIKVYLISTLSDGWRVWTRKYRNCIAWTERARADTRLKKCVDPEGASRHVPPITAWTERARAHTHPPMKPAPPHTALDRGRCKGGRGGRGAPLSARAARQTNQVRQGRTAAITQRQPLLGDESHMRRLVDQLPAGFCRIYLLSRGKCERSARARAETGRGRAPLSKVSVENEDGAAPHHL